MHALAQAATDGAEKAGANVRLRKVAELAPPEAINANPAWSEHLQDTADVEEASLDDLAWADAVLFGTPTRFGNPASQLRAFIDTTGALWQQGKLADKVYSAFTASSGQESTLLVMSNTFIHWGGIIVPPGYTDPVQFKSGNPYGASHVAGDGPPIEVALQAARHQARRAVETAVALKTRERLPWVTNRTIWSTAAAHRRGYVRPPDAPERVDMVRHKSHPRMRSRWIPAVRGVAGPML